MSGWITGEQTVHVNDTRKYVIRLEREQLSRRCLNTSVEILHIPKEVPGVQAAKADFAASSEKETNPSRNASLLIQRH